jgi:hypothetical protein
MSRDGRAVRWLLLAIVVVSTVVSFSAASFSQIAVGISVRIGPPVLPVYAQPICPGPGYLWTPGYWAWGDDDGYYWVPGTWVLAPVGMLWTPGYWGWGGGFYAWHPGYWGPHIGFYGGINYGFGYTGVGFVGGEWRGGAFFYNRYVTNVSVTNVTHVYNRTVALDNTRVVGYNGGAGGIEARPTPEEEAAAHERHGAPLAEQAQHERIAGQNRENFASENHGRPAIAATARPGDFSSRSAVPARSAGGEYHAPAMSPKEARANSAPGNRTRSNEGFRPFTPPAKNGGSAAGGSREDSNRSKESRTNEGRASESRPHSAPPSRESTPKQNSARPSAPPKKPSAPKEERK